MALELPPETWGDQLRRARLHGKRRYGYSYRELAERVAMVLPVTDRALVALEHKIGPPTFKRQRLIAAIYSLALGYSPESLGIDDAVELLRPYDQKRLHAVLDPENWSPKRRRWIEAAQRRSDRSSARKIQK